MPITRRSFQLGLGALLPALRGQTPASKGVVSGAAAGNASVSLPAPAAGERRRLALVIGNNDYRKAPELRNAVNDAVALESQLASLGFEVGKALNADAAAARIAIADFNSRLKPGDVALLFYSGHGVQARGENYLAPVDFDPAGGEARLEAQCIAATGAREGMEKAGAWLNILILDACRDNPFRPGEAVKGMALMEPGLGSCIALATGPGRTASDNPGERNGLFTKHLLKQLAGPGQPIESLFKNVKDAVAADSGGAQRPWVFSDIVGEFLLGAGAAVFSASGRAAEYLETGERQYRAGRFEEAAASFEKATRVSSENAFAYNALGSARARLNQWSVAVGLYSKAIDLKEDYAAAYFNRGLAYFRDARYPLALQDFDWAVQQQPDDPRSLDLRGKTHLALRDTELALSDFDAALELDPTDSAARAGRGSVYFRQGRYPDALREFTAALSLKAAADTYRARADVYRALHQAAQADADEEKASLLRTRP